MFPDYPADVSDDAKEAMAWAAYSDADASGRSRTIGADEHDAGFARVEKVDLAGDGTCRGGVSTR